MINRKAQSEKRRTKIQNPKLLNFKLSFCVLRSKFFAFILIECFLFTSVTPTFASDSSRSHLRQAPTSASSDGGIHLLSELRTLQGAPLKEAVSLADRIGDAKSFDERIVRLRAILREKGSLASPPEKWIPILTYALTPNGSPRLKLFTAVEKNQEEIFQQCESCGVRLLHQAPSTNSDAPSLASDLLGALATAIDAVQQGGRIRTHPVTHEVMHSAYALSRLVDGSVIRLQPGESELDRIGALLGKDAFLIAHVSEKDPSGDHFVQIKEIGKKTVTIFDRGEEKVIPRGEFSNNWTGVIISHRPVLERFALKDTEAQKVFGCCGIVGYVRLNPATKTLVNDLQIAPLVIQAASGVEQRAGRHGQGVTAWSFDDNGTVFSETRKVTEGADALKDVLERHSLTERAFAFLFHGRWPTQGKNTIHNAHPHRVGPVELGQNGDAVNNGRLLAFLSGETLMRGEAVGEVTLTKTFVQLLSSRAYLMFFVAWQLGITVEKYLKDPEKPKKEEVDALREKVLAELKNRKNRLDLRVKRPSHVTTDAWTLTALVNHYFILELLEGRDSKMAMLHAMRRTRRIVEGYFSIWVVDRDEPWRIYGLGIEDQPMVLGVGRKEPGNFLTSDPIAFLDHTSEAVFLQNDDYVVVTHDGYEIFRLPGTVGFGEEFPFVVEDKAPTEEQIKFQRVPKEERPPYELDKEEFRVTKEHRGITYRYFTEKEIYQQPDTIDATMHEDNRIGVLRRLAQGEDVSLPGVGFSKGEIRGAKRVLFVASGTSEHASLMGQSKFFKAAGIETDVQDGQVLVETIQDYVVDRLYAMAKSKGLQLTRREISRRLPVSQPGTIAHVIEKYRIKIPGIGGPEEIAVAVSQSGNTKDTLGALALLKALGTKVIAIVNKPGLPPIAQAAVEIKEVGGETQRVIHLFKTKAGLEKGVASTKATTSQITAIQLLGLYFGLVRGTYEPELVLEYLDDLEKIPGLAQKMLLNDEMHEALKRVARRLIIKQSTTTMGRGGKSRGLGWAKETSLKAEELGYQTFKPLHLSGMKHGPIAVFPDDYDQRVREYVIASLLDMGTHNESILNLTEIIARQGLPILFVYEDESLTDFREVVKKAGSELEVIEIPRMDDSDLAVILAVIPAQLLAFYTARELQRVSLEVQGIARSLYWAATNEEWEIGGKVDSAFRKYNELLSSGQLGTIPDTVKWDIYRAFRNLQRVMKRPRGRRDEVPRLIREQMRNLLRELKDDGLSTILFFEGLLAVKGDYFPSTDPRSRITQEDWREMERIYREIIPSGSKYGPEQFDELVKAWRTFLVEKKIEEGGGEEGLVEMYEKFHVTRGLAQKLERHIDLPRGLAKEVTVNDGGNRSREFFASREGFEGITEEPIVSAYVAPDRPAAADGGTKAPLKDTGKEVFDSLSADPLIGAEGLRTKMDLFQPVSFFNAVRGEANPDTALSVSVGREAIQAYQKENGLFLMRFAEEDPYQETIEDLALRAEENVPVVLSISHLLRQRLTPNMVRLLLEKAKGRLYFTRPERIDSEKLGKDQIDQETEMKTFYGDFMDELERSGRLVSPAQKKDGHLITRSLKELGEAKSAVLLLDEKDQRRFEVAPEHLLSPVTIGKVQNAFAAPLNAPADVTREIYLGFLLASQPSVLSHLEEADTTTKFLLAEVTQGFGKSGMLVTSVEVLEKINDAQQTVLQVLKGL